MIDCAQVLGAVIAGGLSTRMGKDKSLMRLGGLPLIEHAARFLLARFPRVIIVSDHPDKYRFLNLEIIPDLHKGIGPLGGIHAALAFAHKGVVFISSCDTPLVPPPLIDYLLAVDSPQRTRIPRLGGIFQPLLGSYDASLLPAIERSIANREHRVTSLLEENSFLSVEISSDLPFYSPDMFSNINSPDDFAQMERRITASRSRRDNQTIPPR